MCDNKVLQTVPTRYSAKLVELKCGSTSIYGDRLYCGECEKKYETCGYHPYQCRHGKDMSREGSFCSRCEFGDDE
jgi:hypothetical protein